MFPDFYLNTYCPTQQSSCCECAGLDCGQLSSCDFPQFRCLHVVKWAISSLEGFSKANHLNQCTAARKWAARVLMLDRACMYMHVRIEYKIRYSQKVRGRRGSITIHVLPSASGRQRHLLRILRRLGGFYNAAVIQVGAAVALQLWGHRRIYCGRHTLRPLLPAPQVHDLLL